MYMILYNYTGRQDFKIKKPLIDCIAKDISYDFKAASIGGIKLKSDGF